MITVGLNCMPNKNTRYDTNDRRKWATYYPEKTNDTDRRLRGAIEHRRVFITGHILGPISAYTYPTNVDGHRCSNAAK